MADQMLTTTAFDGHQFPLDGEWKLGDVNIVFFKAPQGAIPIVHDNKFMEEFYLTGNSVHEVETKLHEILNVLSQQTGIEKIYVSHRGPAIGYQIKGGSTHAQMTIAISVDMKITTPIHLSVAKETNSLRLLSEFNIEF